MHVPHFFATHPIVVDISITTTNVNLLPVQESKNHQYIDWKPRMFALKFYFVHSDTAADMQLTWLKICIINDITTNELPCKTIRTDFR